MVFLALDMFRYFYRALATWPYPVLFTRAAYWFYKGSTIRFQSGSTRCFLFQGSFVIVGTVVSKV